MSDTLLVIPASTIGCEPEEAPAKRVIDMTSTVSLSGGQPDIVTRQGRPALSFPHATKVARIPTPVTAEMPAGEVAGLLRKRCARCVHFRRDLWRETITIWARSPEASGKKRGLDAMVLQLARACTTGIPSLRDLKLAEQDLRTWGICGALTEEKVDLSIVHPDACCPDEVDRYVDASREARREAGKVFDRIMRMAQGRE